MDRGSGVNANAVLPLIDHDPVRGRLSVGGHGYLLIRPETLAPLLRSANPEVRSLLVEGGRAGGVAAARVFLTRRPGGPDDFEVLLSSGGGLGWGGFEVVRVEADLIEVVLKNSPFADVAGPRIEPACHPVRGVLEGMAATFWGGEWAAAETACAACGNGCCRFEIRRGPGEVGG